MNTFLNLLRSLFKTDLPNAIAFYSNISRQFPESFSQEALKNLSCFE